MTGRGPSSCVRWRADVGWEKRCENCVHSALKGGAYWPLTFEFWNPHRSMVRCRACLRHYANASRNRLSAGRLQLRMNEKRAARAAWVAEKRRQAA